MSPSEIGWNNSHQTDSTEWFRLCSIDTVAKILDLVEDAIVCAGSEERVVLFNHGAERLFGYSASDILGKPLALLLPSHFGPDRGAHIVEFAGPLQGSRPRPERQEIVANRKDGEEFHAEASIGTFQTEDGRICAVILRESTQQEAWPARPADKRRAINEIRHASTDSLQFDSSSLQFRDIGERVTDPMFHGTENRGRFTAQFGERVCGQKSQSPERVSLAGSVITVFEERAVGQGRIVASSESMRQVLRFATRVATSEASTILIQGESGVGKDVLARFIHDGSSRRSNAFLAVNCAAIPETLLESELFGYEKGAFTDARNQKRGILEVAGGGTVLLDEIGELSVALQAKLLRVLEEHQFRRLGGTRDLEVDLRVIAATNRDLKKAIEHGRFRLDLYYRLNAIQTTIPPLRERKEDIIPLAQYFVALYNRKFRREVKGLAADAVSALYAHTWPGNIRELRNAIERAMLMHDTAWIRGTDLGIVDDAPLASITGEESSADPSLAEVERTMLVRALTKAAWNQTRASHLLRISRDSLRYKIKKFRLKEPQVNAMR